MADGFQGSGRTENLDYSLMKVTVGIHCSCKIYKSIPYFVMNWHSASTGNFFPSLLAPEVVHVQSCTVLVVQLQCGCNPGGISLSCPAIFIGRRS